MYRRRREDPPEDHWEYLDLPSTFEAERDNNVASRQNIQIDGRSNVGRVLAETLVTFDKNYQLVIGHNMNKIKQYIWSYSYYEL